MQSGQRLQSERYAIVPRTLSFLIHEDDILLLKLPTKAGEWAGKYNGVGGHVEKGEDPRSTAFREILEETGIEVPKLSLCGVILIDTGEDPGIGLFIFVGSLGEKVQPQETPEGKPEWVKRDELDQLPLVEDLSFLLPETFAAYEAKRVFSARYQFDVNGILDAVFHNDAGLRVNHSPGSS